MKYICANAGISDQASGTACYDVQSFSLSARPGGFVLTFLLRTPFDSAFHIGLIGSVTHKKPGLFSYKPDCFHTGNADVFGKNLSGGA